MLRDDGMLLGMLTESVAPHVNPILGGSSDDTNEIIMAFGPSLNKLVDSYRELPILSGLIVKTCRGSMLSQV